MFTENRTYFKSIVKTQSPCTFLHFVFRMLIWINRLCWLPLLISIESNKFDTKNASHFTQIMNQIYAHFMLQNKFYDWPNNSIFLFWEYCSLYVWLCNQRFNKTFLDRLKLFSPLLHHLIDLVKWYKYYFVLQSLCCHAANVFIHKTALNRFFCTVVRSWKHWLS